MADRRLVRVAHVDDHRVRLRHHLVVLVGLDVLRARRLERRRLLAREPVRHELVRLADRERLEALRVRHAVGQLEVGLEEDRLPPPQPLAEGADPLRRARQRAVEPLGGAAAAAADLGLAA